MRADFFTKPLQGMLFYHLRDLIMNLGPENPYHSLHRSVLQDMDEGCNKSSDNPANSAQGTETPSGACIPTHRVYLLALPVIVIKMGFRTIHTLDQHHLINSN